MYGFMYPFETKRVFYDWPFMSLDKENLRVRLRMSSVMFFIGFGLYEGIVEENLFVQINFWEGMVALVKNFKFLSELHHNSYAMKQY